MEEEAASIALRRSTRVHVRTRVTVSGTLPNGKPFEEDAYISSISKYGARLETQLPLKVGMRIQVRPQHREEAGLFRVVWVGEEGTSRAGEVGIAYEQVSEFLGVAFPE
jgi:hypothetical protein